MTSPLVWDAGVEPAVDDLDAEGDSGEGALAGVVTPWTRKPRQGASPGAGGLSPGAGSGGNSQASQEGSDSENNPALPGQSSGDGSGQGAVAPGQGGSGKGVVPPAGAPGAAGAQAAPAPSAPAEGAAAQAAPAQAAPAPAGTVAPNTSRTTDDSAADHGGGLLDPDTLTALAP
ncbi:hypothetical protein AB0J47_06825, partial [Nocardia sp. NPDC049737]